MSKEDLRYAAAACQVDFPNPADRPGIKPHTDRMLDMISQAVEGYAPFLPVKLVVFPEFAHAALNLGFDPLLAVGLRKQVVEEKFKVGFLIFLASLFPITTSAMAAVQNIQINYIRAARNFGITGLELFRQVVFPASLPQILTGLSGR